MNILKNIILNILKERENCLLLKIICNPYHRCWTSSFITKIFKLVLHDILFKVYFVSDWFFLTLHLHKISINKGLIPLLVNQTINNRFPWQDFDDSAKPECFQPKSYETINHYFMEHFKMDSCFLPWKSFHVLFITSEDQNGKKITLN